MSDSIAIGAADITENIQQRYLVVGVGPPPQTSVMETAFLSPSQLQTSLEKWARDKGYVGQFVAIECRAAVKIP